ncbi:hypothetical protein ONZ45_g13321 [Pleurotus djamor]|nr:hypothetical protein ONZ45_g13321 [Pleurotus djamor]
MFAGFKRALPEISIFHNPTSPPSTKALGLLRASVSGPYPPGNKGASPLAFNLEVIESPPTADQLRTISSFIPSKSSSSTSLFLSAHPSSSEAPQSVSEIVKLAKQNPNTLKWPIVVDWSSGKAAIGSVDSVEGILEHLRKQRDGEIEGDAVDQPKGWFS